MNDDVGFREVVHELLEHEGFGVETAENGREALDLLKTGLRPRAILLDLMMPTMDGWAFRAEQLQTDDIKHIPVAVLSGSGLTSQAIRDRMGNVEYFAAPMDTQALVGFVERCCRPGVTRNDTEPSSAMSD